MDHVPNLTKILALIISIIFLLRIVLALLFKQMGAIMARSFYRNSIKKYIYLLIFAVGSYLLLKELSVFQYLIAFVTMGALYFDFYHSGIVPEEIRKTLLPYISKPQHMWIFMLTGGAISIWVIISYIRI